MANNDIKTCFEDYIDKKELEVKPEYQKEFISLWSGWLGEKALHKLDEVTEEEWSRFNNLIRLISAKYDMLLVDFKNKTLTQIDDIETTLSDYKTSMNKSASDFSYYVVPELNCVISEDWDYTYIIWYKQNIINELEDLIEKAGLYHFN